MNDVVLWITVVVAALISVGAVLWSLWPLLQPGRAHIVLEDDRLTELLGRKNAALGAINSEGRENNRTDLTDRSNPSDGVWQARVAQAPSPVSSRSPDDHELRQPDHAVAATGSAGIPAGSWANQQGLACHRGLACPV